MRVGERIIIEMFKIIVQVFLIITMKNGKEGYFDVSP
jgi:hypothetical protein